MLWIVLGLAAFVMVGVVVAGAAGLYLYSADPVRPPPTAVDPYATPWGSNDPLIEREQPLIVPPPPFAPQSEIVPPPAAPPGNDDVPSN
jgi:hypothetical protein